jgi:hypothetical protein
MMQSKNRIAVPQTINAPISLRKVKSAVRPGVNETEVCCRHEISKREQQYVAEQQTVNWLPDDDGILAYVQQKQHHQLAGKQHRRSWRSYDAERQ